jgi:hypothetical protein
MKSDLSHKGRGDTELVAHPNLIPIQHRRLREAEMAQ